MKIEDRLSWLYNESKHVGTDYSLSAEVQKYDSSHSEYRDLEKECDVILGTLDIGERDAVIDFGAGTGTFAIRAALRCSTVYAVDVSQAMIDYAKTKAARAGVSNIIFCQDGFLTYDHKGPAVSCIVTMFAFHHLPDFWKGEAIKRMYQMMKPDGQLYIHDVILTEHRPIENITALIERLNAKGSDLLKQEAEEHFKQEYSTYDWIMEGLLSRAGFAIKDKVMQDGVMGTYLCTK